MKWGKMLKAVWGNLENKSLEKRMFLERKDFCSNELSVCQMVYLLLSSMFRNDFDTDE